MSAAEAWPIKPTVREANGEAWRQQRKWRPVVGGSGGVGVSHGLCKYRGWPSVIEGNKETFRARA